MLVESDGHPEGRGALLVSSGCQFSPLEMWEFSGSDQGWIELTEEPGFATFPDEIPWFGLIRY
ncbi:MAG: hypothetical protein H6736_21755 [Alphaproteobacteria bacterium]|nr:hypothetical protein [Alphaproteobacteria bacterium]